MNYVQYLGVFGCFIKSARSFSKMYSLHVETVHFASVKTLLHPQPLHLVYVGNEHALSLPALPESYYD